MYEIEDFDFTLPEELIAQTPLKERATSKMLVLNRETKEISDLHFYDILEFLNEGDGLVINESRVLPARLFGIKEQTGAHIEILLLHQEEGDVWECLVKPAKKAKKGTRISFGDGLLMAEVIEELPEGGRKLAFSYQGVFLEILSQLGEMPLPPYIKVQLEDPERYQTVFARENGSAAAPTAGLHFTPELLKAIEDKGVHIIPLVLHVGLGTFRPVSVDRIEDHKMHSEYYSLSDEGADKIKQIKANGNKITAVGTTTVRTLETIVHNKGALEASSGWTDIFIKPGYEFKVVDHLITNFHLPKSTLMMLVSAFYDRDEILKAYEHAIDEHYRFFSFGDAMLIL